MKQYPVGPDRRFVQYGLFDYLLLILYVLLIISLGVFGIGLKHYLWQQSFLAKALTATGTVIQVDDRWGKSGSLYQPTVQFTPVNSTIPVTFTSHLSTSKYIGVGDPVTVYYQPDFPTEADVEEAVRSPVFGFAFMGFGGLFAALFIAGIRKSLIGYEESTTSQPTDD